MDFNRIFTSRNSHSYVLALLVNLAIAPVSSAISTNENPSLETAFQKTTNDLYKTLAKNLSQCRNRTRSLKRLNIQLQKLEKQNKNIIGICLIQNHISLLEKNIDNKEIFPIFKFLLDNDNLLFANKLYLKAKKEGDRSLISNISFIYANYYLQRKDWKKVILHTQGIYSDLTFEQANQARLFNGIALQKIKKHRKAIKIYSKIEKQSKYYPAAKLNIATANIRQDWWTDAHININEVISNPKLKTHNEMINRLNLVLGYSLLRKELYRDSREAFRNIEIDSIYFNKALLGIALTAISQEDYIGALNAIKILNKKTTYDLSVDESHILLPYIYEKLNQNMTASASYTDAQKYYQQRIKKISSIKEKESLNLALRNSLTIKGDFTIDNNIINLSKYIPISFIKENNHLFNFSKYIANIDNALLKTSYEALKEKHNLMLAKAAKAAIDERVSYLKSYMNQSRFGLARLFDSSSIEK